MRCESKGHGRKLNGIQREGALHPQNMDMSDMEPVELQHFGAGWGGHDLDGSETRISSAGCM